MNPWNKSQWTLFVGYASTVGLEIEHYTIGKKHWQQNTLLLRLSIFIITKKNNLNNWRDVYKNNITDYAGWHLKRLTMFLK